MTDEPKRVLFDSRAMLETEWERDKAELTRDAWQYNGKNGGVVFIRKPYMGHPDD